MTTIDNTTWVSTRDTADMLGITAQAVYRLLNRGTLPHRRIGRSIEIPLDAVLARMEGTRDRTSVSRRECRRFILEETGADSINNLLPGEVTRWAYQFIEQRRPGFSEDDRNRFAEAMAAQLLAGRA